MLVIEILPDASGSEALREDLEVTHSHWSLRNKTEDIKRALAQGSSTAARMAAHELGVRLSHTVAAAQEHADSGNAHGHADSQEKAIESVLSRLGEELGRLMPLIKSRQALRATEVLQMMFELLDELDRDAPDGNVN